MNSSHSCPVCGYSELEEKPYANMPEDAASANVHPPYKSHWGQPSFELCSCCGFEFGCDDDNPEASLNKSFSEYLKAWIDDTGCKWFDPDMMPEGWSLREQMDEAEIDMP